MIAQSIHLVIPELIILAGACIALFAGMGPQRQVPAYVFAQLSVLAATIVLLTEHPFGSSMMAFNQFFVLDDIARLVKVGLCIFTLFVFLYARGYVERKALPGGEYYALCLFALLGMMVMTSSAHMLTLYLSLEILALSLYPLIALQRDESLCSEAAMKYFVLGAVASGILLYGISLLYGLTGSLGFAEIQASLQQDLTRSGVVHVAALLFIIVGIAFKLGAAPFHMWLPDVYQGAPYAVAVFIASVTKLAAFMMTYRLLVDASMVLSLQWKPILATLAVLSLVFGNLAAIMQTNIRRMLAYSAIAHAGFVLLGFVAATPSGFGASLFYTLIYVLMGLGVFGVLTTMSTSAREITLIDDLRGLGRSRPWFAFLMMVLLFSMAGIPLTAGFYAKFAVLQAILEDAQISLAVIAVMATVVGAYYYLRVIKVMYFEPSESTALELPAVSPVVLFSLSLNCIAIIALFLFPASLMQMCMRVFH